MKVNRTFLILALPLTLVLGASDTTPQERYISEYSSLAVSEMARSGIPASIILAQGLVESGAGQSALAQSANNHFGIKCHNDWNGGRFYQDDDSKGECFRVYLTAADSYMDHSDFLTGKDRYKSLFKLPVTDYKAWAKGLRKAGYATDRKYADKLIKVIEEYRLYLYDTGASVPEAPAVEESGNSAQWKEVAEQPAAVSQQGKASANSEFMDFPLQRQVFLKDGVPCVISVEGDTYATLAASNGLFLREILRYNGLMEEKDIIPGTIIRLKKPRHTRHAE